MSVLGGWKKQCYSKFLLQPSTRWSCVVLMRGILMKFYRQSKEYLVRYIGEFYNSKKLSINEWQWFHWIKCFISSPEVNIKLTQRLLKLIKLMWSKNVITPLQLILQFLLIPLKNIRVLFFQELQITSQSPLRKVVC